MSFCILVLSAVYGVLLPKDSIVAPIEKPFGAVLRTVREYDMAGDTLHPYILQVETNKAKRFDKIVVSFGIYTKTGKKVFSDSWKAASYFEKRDTLSDTIKWLRLQRILRGFFVNQNFIKSGEQPLDSIIEGAAPGEIKPGSKEAQEFDASPHTVFSVYGGRNKLYALTWLRSQQRFVIVWRS